MGGDSDTNAAIYGQLGGAFYGIEGIPASWRERVHLGEEIDQLARDLVDLRLEPPRDSLRRGPAGEGPPPDGPRLVTPTPTPTPNAYPKMSHAIPSHVFQCLKSDR